MSLRSVSLGHADRKVNRAARRAMRAGVNLPRATPLEFEVAELLHTLVPSAEMVKFGKNGSDATSAAIRLARAFTGRNVILRPVEDAFLSVHDWFIGSTSMNAGVPEEVRGLTKTFRINDLSSLDAAFDKALGDVACVIMEPAGASNATPEFLLSVRHWCTRRGIPLIFDEIVSGFRVHPGGAQALYGVTPDLSTLGKGMANGYPLSALVGKRELMQLGDQPSSRNRTFLLSSTFGPETVSLAAAKQTIERLQDGLHIQENAAIGERLSKMIEHNLYKSLGSQQVQRNGPPANPFFIFSPYQSLSENQVKGIFMEELFRQKIFVNPNLFCPSACHRGRVLNDSLSRIEEALELTAHRLEGTASDDSREDECWAPTPVFPPI